MAKTKQYAKQKTVTPKGCGIAVLIFLGLGLIPAILQLMGCTANYLVQNPWIFVILIVGIALIVFLYIKYIKPWYWNFRMNRVQGKIDGIKTALDAAPTLDSLQVSAKLINTTVEPSEFFYQFDYLVKQLEWIIHSDIDRKYLTASPEKDLRRLLGGKDKTMELFIDRCLKSVMFDLANCKTQEEAYKIKDRYYLINNYSDVLSEKNYERFKSKLDGLDSFAAHMITQLPCKIELPDNCDETLMQAIECVVEAGMASTSQLQRRLKLGYARAARIIDDMESLGVVGSFKGSAPRDVLITREQIKNINFNSIQSIDVSNEEQAKKDLSDKFAKTGVISVSEIQETYRCDMEEANKKLDAFILWGEAEQKRNPNFNMIIDRGNRKHYDNMDGLEFEHFCADLLRKNGFSNVEVTSGSGDYGVDVFAEMHGATYAIQCKRYSSNVGNDAIQEIYSGKDFYKRNVGVVMTNQYFTSSAKETAKRTSIVLWDRDWLESMIK